jgi:hypothetical protein
MEYEIKFAYTPQLVSSAAKSHWLREYGWSYFYYCSVPLVTFALCLTSSEITSSRAGNLVLGFLLGIVATLGFQFFYQFLSFEKGAAEAARQWNGVEVTYRFNEAGMAMDSAVASGNYAWKMIVKVRHNPKVWMFFFGEQDYGALPAEHLSNELRQFVIRKVSEAGGKIVPS